MMIPYGMPFPEIRFDHLHRLTGEFGVFEHADHHVPRVGHGYTTDDNSRVLAVLADETGARERRLLRKATDYVLDARGTAGWRNRRSAKGVWTDLEGSDDSMGRALWGLGHLVDRDTRVAVSFTHLLSSFRSPHPRAIAYATLGASLAVPHLPAVEPLLARLTGHLPRPRRGAWQWPSPRLTYANPRIPQALIVSGAALEDHSLVEAGLELLEWLISIETGDSGFSFTPVGGRGPGDPRPGFDQQPIEAWAMIEACESAARIDAGRLWPESLVGAGLWFLGRNDVGARLYDEETGAGYDGLTPSGVNQNRGAESTLAALGSLLALRRLLTTQPVP